MKMNTKSMITRDYEEILRFRLEKNKAKQSQFQKGMNECKLLYIKGL